MLSKIHLKKIKDSNYVVNSNIPIKKVLQRLNSQKNKIIFILNQKNKLLGSITDGDIRRKFMEGNSLKDNLNKFYNKKPHKLISGKKNYNKELIFAKKNHINEVPVVTKKNYYLGFIKLKDLDVYKDNLSNKFDIVVMAGGFGKRLLPITKKIPKPLVKVNGVAIIDGIIEKCKIDAINKIHIILHYKAKLIKEYLIKRFPKLKHKFQFIVEKKPLDTAGGLKLINFKISSESYLLINSDLITNINFESLHEFFKDNKADLVVCATKNEILIPYGVLNVNNKKVKNITEKPTFNIHINSGIYILNKKIINFINKNEKISAVELMKRSIKKNKRVLYYPIYEKWIDIGNHTDLIKAKNF